MTKIDYTAAPTAKTLAASDKARAQMFAFEDRQNVSAHIILKDGELVARVLFGFARSGLAVTAYGQNYTAGAEGARFHKGTAKGGGYDRKTAALVGFLGIVDDGREWYNQLREMGYTVIQAL